MGAADALDHGDGRGIAGATTTMEDLATTSKRSVGSRGQGGDNDDDIDPRGDDDNNTTISLAMAMAPKRAMAAARAMVTTKRVKGERR
jgi:hypothetical protein